MKSNDKKLLGLVLLGGAALYYFMQQSRPQYVGPYSNIPPPPPPASPNYQVWVDAILKTFGQVASLWAPGGPFYNQPGAPPPPGGTTPPGPNPGNPAAPGGIYGLNSGAGLLALLPGF